MTFTSVSVLKSIFHTYFPAGPSTRCQAAISATSGHETSIVGLLPKLGQQLAPFFFPCFTKPRGVSATQEDVGKSTLKPWFLGSVRGQSLLDQWKFSSLISYILKKKREKNLPAMQETQVWSPGGEDLLEKGMTIHSNILAWGIPWTEEPGGLQSLGSQSHTWLSD